MKMCWKSTIDNYYTKEIYVQTSQKLTQKKSKALQCRACTLGYSICLNVKTNICSETVSSRFCHFSTMYGPGSLVLSEQVRQRLIFIIIVPAQCSSERSSDQEIITIILPRIAETKIKQSLNTIFKNRFLHILLVCEFASVASKGWMGPSIWAIAKTKTVLSLSDQS